MGLITHIGLTQSASFWCDFKRLPKNDFFNVARELIQALRVTDQKRGVMQELCRENASERVFQHFTNVLHTVYWSP